MHHFTNCRGKKKYFRKTTLYAKYVTANKIRRSSRALLKCTSLNKTETGVNTHAYIPLTIIFVNTYICI